MSTAPIFDEPFDLGKLRDTALLPLAEKVVANRRLSPGDAVLLFSSPDILGVGLLADFANRRKNGEVVTFAANQHINPTNV